MFATVKKSAIVIAIEKKDGTIGYISNSGGSYSYTVVSDPGQAKQWPVDAPKDEIVKTLDKARSSVNRTTDPGTMRVVMFHTLIEELPDDDFEWQKAIRLNAVSKLTRQEIEALKIEAAHIELKLNSN